MNKALGLIETIGLVTAIEAADAAAKAANITLLGYENTKGSGKITIKLVGDVGAVQAAVAAGVAAAQRIGKVYSHSVIPRPHGEIEALIHQVDRGHAKAPAAPVAATPVAAPEAPADEAAASEAETPAAENHRCTAITQSGEQCKLPARPDSLYCNIHRKLETAG
jgi:ethanolamine utilization protein EutM